MNFKKESIFVTAVRSFLACFSAILGILIGVSLFFIGMGVFSGPDILPDRCALKIAPDAFGNRTLLADSAPVVLKLNITGVIGKDDLTQEKIENLLLDSREGVLQNGRVKAIFLHINSPGGTSSDSDGIYRALLRYKAKYHVPIYAYVEDLCASGGMYIACAADKIYAHQTSIIGSVGALLGPVFNFSGLMERYGVQSLTITNGKDKDMLNPYRPWVPGEDSSLRAINADLYETFVNIVTNARPRLDKTKLINEYGAQIYPAKIAEEYGYIDVANSSYAEALTDLTKAAGFKDPNFYQVFELEVPHSFLKDLAQLKSPLFTGKINHTVQLNPLIDSELSGKFLYLYVPQNLSE